MEIKTAQYRSRQKETKPKYPTGNSVILPPIDTERYDAIDGLEGPFRLRNGRIVYYDPKEGKYYDRGSDIYIDPREAEENDRSN